MKGKTKKNKPFHPATVSQENVDKIGCVDGLRLRKLRLIRDGLSRRQLYKKTGISLQTIARLEDNLSITTTNTLVKLANHFQVPYGYLLGEDVVNLDGHGLSDELRRKIGKFLEKLLVSKADPIELLDEMCMFLDRKNKNLDTKEGISEEEEVLGLWWSIISSYQHGKWNNMKEQSHNLIDLAVDLGRPYLAAIGHTYKATALRNMGRKKPFENAEKELKDIFRAKNFQSAFTLRIIGKIYSRQDKNNKALQEYEKAEKLMSQSNRKDIWFQLEKTKLLRNIATVHGKLALEAKKDNDNSSKGYHLREATKYTDSCRKLIKELKQIERQAEVETMIMTNNVAHQLETKGMLRQAIDTAKEAMEQANKLGEKDYALRTSMFLFHLYMEQDKKDDAAYHFGRLFPLRRYRTRFEWHYRKFVAPHEKDIYEYIQKQSATLDRTAKTRLRKS